MAAFNPLISNTYVPVDDRVVKTRGKANPANISGTTNPLKVFEITNESGVIDYLSGTSSYKSVCSIVVDSNQLFNIGNGTNKCDIYPSTDYPKNMVVNPLFDVNNPNHRYLSNIQLKHIYFNGSIEIWLNSVLPGLQINLEIQYRIFK